MKNDPKKIKGDQIGMAEIKNLSYSSAGVARTEGKVVFIPYTVTGDIVKFQVLKDKKTYLEGGLLEILKSSAYRRPAPCPYFGRCGGCQWQHIDYNYQIQSKNQITKDIIKRIGRIAEPKVMETIISGGEWSYRQRMRFQIGLDKEDIVFGFNIYNSNKVVDITNCLIAKKPIVELLSTIRQYKNELFDVLDFEIYYSPYEDSFIFSGKTKEQNYNPGRLKNILNLFKGGIIKSKKGVVASYKEPYLNYLVENSQCSYTLKIYADGFIQANSEVNRAILDRLADFFGDRYKDQTILELFAGSGNFTFLFSKLFKYVLAVEGNQLSVRALDENVIKNNINNVHTVRANISNEVIKLFNSHRSFDVIFLDPPRTGAGDIIPYLPKFNPRVIIYLSCNPATLARDLKTLSYSGYRIESIIPFDMFPQTFHIENMAILTK